ALSEHPKSASLRFAKVFCAVRPRRAVNRRNPTMASDAELLHRYVALRDQGAFSELVQRHLGLVYASALRTSGRDALAQEIVQRVFTDLARKAAALQHHPALLAWLYRSTRYAAVAAIREDVRRQKLTDQFAAMSPAFSAPSPTRSKISGMLRSANLE